jgi:hypothetical protein
MVTREQLTSFDRMFDTSICDGAIDGATRPRPSMADDEPRLLTFRPTPCDVTDEAIGFAVAFPVVMRPDPVVVVPVAHASDRNFLFEAFLSPHPSAPALTLDESGHILDDDRRIAAPHKHSLRTPSNGEVPDADFLRPRMVTFRNETYGGCKVSIPAFFDAVEAEGATAFFFPALAGLSGVLGASATVGGVVRQVGDASRPMENSINFSVLLVADARITKAQIFLFSNGSMQVKGVKSCQNATAAVRLVDALLRKFDAHRVVITPSAGKVLPSAVRESSVISANYSCAFALPKGWILSPARMSLFLELTQPEGRVVRLAFDGKKRCVHREGGGCC